MIAALVLASALLAVVDASPAAGATLSPAEIRARVRAAERAPGAYRETLVSVSSDGTTTTRRRLVRGDDEREIDDDGTVHTESGTYRGERWRQNANGLTRDDRGDPGRVATEPETTTVRTGPNGTLAITTLTAKGRGTVDDVDPSSWQVVRREKIAANGTVTTTLDEFRDDGGRTFAHHRHVVNELDRTTSDTRVTAYEPATIADGELAPPPSRRQLVVFPAGITAVDLPAQVGPHIYVRVTIAGRGLDFVLDTGSSAMVLDTKVARELGLPLTAERSTFAAGRTPFARTVVPELRIGSLTMNDVVFTVAPLGWRVQDHLRLAGLLGYDFLAQLGVTIDYARHRVTVVPGSAFVAPADGSCVALDARLGRGVPLVSASIDGVPAERFIVDTGAIGGFTLFDYFVRRDPRVLRSFSPMTSSLAFGGIGGRLPTAPIFARTIGLGTATLRNIDGVRITSDQSFGDDVDGLIGEGILRTFRLDLDYAHERIYLTLNGTAASGS